MAGDRDGTALGLPADPAGLADALHRTGYLADDELATVAWLAARMKRPIMLEGDPGTGKTSLAEAIATALGAPLIRLQCYEGIDASQALYDWDFPRQVLHLRALEAAHGAGGLDVAAVEQDLFDERFLLPRPVLQALQTAPSVLLVDEVDRADDEFEAFLLEVLSTHAVTIPEIGTVRSSAPPLVVLTSNRTREVHDALKRRCLYHWVDYPDPARELAILRRRVPAIVDRLGQAVVAFVQRLRQMDLYKLPGVAETIDWSQALVALDSLSLDPQVVSDTLGALLKYQEDLDRLDSRAIQELLAEINAEIADARFG